MWGDRELERDGDGDRDSEIDTKRGIWRQKDNYTICYYCLLYYLLFPIPGFPSMQTTFKPGIY